MDVKNYYKLLVKQAMVDVIKRILYQFREGKFKSRYCFYITFICDTQFCIGSQQDLSSKEVTIALEDQNSILDISKNFFILKDKRFFSKKITIPFLSITHFVDPRFNFSIYLDRFACFGHRLLTSKFSNQNSLVSDFLNQNYKILDFNSYKNKKKFYS